MSKKIQTEGENGFHPGEKLNRILRKNAAEKKKLTRYQKNKAGSWLFLSPSITGVLIFFGLPFCVVIYYAMVNNPIQHVFV